MGLSVDAYHLQAAGGRWAAGSAAFVRAQHTHTYHSLSATQPRVPAGRRLCDPDGKGGTVSCEVAVGAPDPFTLSSGWQLVLLCSHSYGTSAVLDVALSLWGQYLKSPPSPPRQHPHDLHQPRTQTEDVSYQEH